MIESVNIFDLNTAQVVTGGYDHTFTTWITAADPTHQSQAGIITSRLAKRNIPHHIRYFLDQDDTAPMADFDGPTPQDIKYYIDIFSKLHKDTQQHRVAINCSAGISRSTALGIIAWMIAGFDPEIALDKILKVRRYAWPNTRILRLYDQITGANSYKIISTWKKAKSGELLV